MIRFFEHRAGTEFEGDYTQVLVTRTIGQEAAGLALLSEQYGKTVLADPTAEGLIAHEIAHQWWGVSVTCKDWGHFWLNEGFATFMTAVYLGHRHGASEYVEQVEKWKARWEKLKAAGTDHPLVYSVWSNPSADDRAVVYQKGAYVLHLLRLEMGEDAFWRGIRRYTKWAEVDAAAMPDRPTLRDLGDGIALMRLPTFDVDDDPEAYRTAVERLFGALRQGGATGLVLDVRGNTGGQSDAGAQVIRYLIDRPVNQVSRARERLNEANRGILGYKGKVGQMREMDLSRDGLIKPARATERFDGEVVVLIDAMTYSAGILFATTLQDHQLATVIGQPTGGHANQTGNMEQVRLPNTGLMAYIPARIFVRPNGESGTSPVIPDLIVKPAVGDGDPVLGAAVKYLSAR